MSLEFNPYAQVEGARIKSSHDMSTPLEVKLANPITERGVATVLAGRSAVIDALDPDTDPGRLIVVSGPCSVHDVDQSLEYTAWLRSMRAVYGDDLELIQRIYFEKPRTRFGWEGLVVDPHLDESFDINFGLMAAGRLLRETTDQGVPAGTEWLDTVTPEYYGGMISWGAIGARTTESPLHRRLASGLSSPVGFKNGRSGDIQVAVDAVISAGSERHFIGTNENGRPVNDATTGNPDCHIVLRGGASGPNYSAKSVAAAASALGKDGLAERVMIDASHDNSQKDYRNQLTVVRDIAAQVAAGSPTIMGVMIESNLRAGRQEFNPGGRHEYGISITDGCVDLEETTIMFELLADAVQARRTVRQSI